MEKLIRFAVVGLCFMVSACASSIQHRENAPDYSYKNEKFCKVDLTVSKDATKDPNDRVRFDENKLRNMIERKLEVCGLVDANSLKKVNIEITDIRVRSTFNAFMWGFMAGNDHIRGDVSLIGDNGNLMHTFHVSASYALGGFAGMNEARMSWLYEEFSKLAVDEIMGKNSSGTQ